MRNPDGSVISYAYDATGNRISVTIPSGTTNYAYDALNRLVTVTDPDGGVTSYAYDKVGNRKSVTYPNGTVAEYMYDRLNRLIRLVNRTSAGDLISGYVYTLGPAGNRLRIEELHSYRVVDYTYDDLNRLTEENISDPVLGNETISYIYDDFGNRLSKTDSSGTTAYEYDANDRLISEGSTTYSYDNNGNMVGKNEGTETTFYGYDYENRLVFMQDSEGITEYAYDADGIRVRSVANGVATNYLVDKNRAYAQVLEERDDAGSLVVAYVYGDDLISQKRGDSVSYYHYDGLGSTRALTDEAENVTDTYIYEAFGGLLHSTGNTLNNYLFTGEQYDGNAGFVYLRARWMNPDNGRFLTTDPWQGNMSDIQSLHKYAYAHLNPINRTDPSGLWSLNEINAIQRLQQILSKISKISKGRRRKAWNVIFANELIHESIQIPDITHHWFIFVERIGAGYGYRYDVGLMNRSDIPALRGANRYNLRFPGFIMRNKQLSYVALKRAVLKLTIAKFTNKQYLIWHGMVMAAGIVDLMPAQFSLKHIRSGTVNCLKWSAIAAGLAVAIQFL